MIARPHICLRCQLRLAGRRPSKVQLAFQSTTANPENGPRQSPGGNSEGRPTYNSTLLQPKKVTGRPLLSQHPLGKLYGYTGNRQRENRERLDVDALGEPAEVIVLRDSKYTTYDYAKEYQVVEPVESIDILAALDNERGLVGQKEVEENINQFRPKKGEEPQDWDGFNKLVQDMQAGFTVSQLARYIQSFNEANGGEKSSPSVGFLIPRISPWMPESSKSTTYLDGDSTGGYSVASYTNKQRLVLRLIRECWKLALPEVEEVIGEVELELKPGDYDLLLKGSRPVLGSIAAEYIDGENERIDGFRSKRTIRITTTRAKSELIVKEIEEALKNIRRKYVDLTDLKPAGYNWRQFTKWVDIHFDESTIKELGHITNTDIQVLSKKRLLISCIDRNPEAATGNRIDTAIRLLVTSRDFSNRVSSWLGYRETPGMSDGAFVEYTATDGLVWRDRLRQWTRWTTPIAKKVEEQNEPAESTRSLETPTEDKASSHEPKRVTKKQQEPTEVETDDSQHKPKGYAYWQDNYHTESSALLGSIIHSHLDPAKPFAKALQSMGETSDVRRAFSTAVPNLSTILGSKPTRAIRRKPLESLIMRFQPNPFFIPKESTTPIGIAALSAFPPIEMRFATNQETKELELKDIQAVVSLENSDIMLPDSAVDLRFQQRSLSRFRVLHNRYPSGITEFLHNSTLNLSQGKLETPAKLTIPIARHLCQEPGLDLLGKKEAEGDLHDVEYLFAGLEIRKTMVLEFEGWRLLYTSIEAGKAGGRRGELRLRPIRTKRFGQEDTEAAFVDTAYRLADALATGEVESNVVRKVPSLVPIARMVGSTVDRKASRKTKAPRYFSKRVDIRDPSREVKDGKMMEEDDEELAVLEEEEEDHAMDEDKEKAVS